MSSCRATNAKRSARNAHISKLVAHEIVTVSRDARWLVWENVPGVFSVDDGAAFRTFVELMVECGYGVAWRVLDAQHFGVPQRRARVFVVGYLGDWRPPVAVLLEADGGVARTMTAHQTFALGVVPIQDTDRPRLRSQNGIGVGEVGDPMYTMTTRGDHGVFAFDYQQITSMENRTTVLPGRPSPTITRESKITVAGELRPRRLTPREVERCFGFADDYTLVPVGRKVAKDAPRYKALGNSMAVPVLSWIGRRMLQVDELVRRVSLAGEVRR